MNTVVEKKKKKKKDAMLLIILIKSKMCLEKSLATQRSEEITLSPTIVLEFHRSMSFIHWSLLWAVTLYVAFSILIGSYWLVLVNVIFQAIFCSCFRHFEQCTRVNKGNHATCAIIKYRMSQQ